jgi:hypothetical protein
MMDIREFIFTIENFSVGMYRIPQPLDAFVALTSMIAVSTGSIVADLQDIPNGPIRFMVRLFQR